MPAATEGGSTIPELDRMNRRDFLGAAGAGLGVLLGLDARAVHPGREVRNGPRDTLFPPGEVGSRQILESLRLDATLQARAFAASTGDDARYHALVHEQGGAAPKSLLTTPTSDREVAARLREMGASDEGGVPMPAWTLRKIPLVPWPNARVQGTPVRIWVEWDGWERSREISGLLGDPGGRGVSFRFGGNEEHDDAWESGCIACLFSCPGGVISNERYTIRDRVRGATRFTPADDLPPDGTAVGVRLELLAG